jgi:hypothetical protein
VYGPTSQIAPMGEMIVGDKLTLQLLRRLCVDGLIIKEKE